MPIDASIPLQIHQPKFATPLEAMTLRDLATRSQINDVNLQEKQIELGKRNSLLQIMQTPGMVDQSGAISPQGLAQVSRIDPEMGLKLGEQQKRLTLQNLAFSEKRDAVKRDILTSYVQLADHYKQVMGDPQAAEQRAKSETMQMVEEGKKTGRYAEHGFSPDELSHELPPVEMARRTVTILGGKMPEQPKLEHVTAANKESSTGLGFLDPKTGTFLKDANGKVVEAPATNTTLMMSGQLDLPPATAKFVAQQYLAGDNQAAQGFARNARARAQIAQAIADEAKAQGMTPKDAAAAVGAFQGYKAEQRTLGTRTANIETAATEARLLSDLALKASAEWERMGVKTFNDLQKAAQSRTASPELRKFVAANTSFINAYARAINPQGVGTVADKEHAREMLEVGFSKGDYRAVIDQLQSEIKAAQQAPAEVKKKSQEAFAGKKPQETETPKEKPDIKSLLDKYK